jgi:hypothetical protein
MKDPLGNLWTITSLWQFENYLCMSLMTADGSQLGGHRIQLYQMNY